MVNIEK